MKALRTAICGLIIALTAPMAVAGGFDLKNLVGGGNSSDALGDVVGGILSAVTQKDVTAADLVGEWKYSSPAVSFESENMLQNIGGEAVTATIEKKLAPYYKKAGMNNLVLTVKEDQSFTMKMKLASLKGHISVEGETLYFNFEAFDAISLGSIMTMATISGKNLSLTFDVSKIKEVVETAASVANNSTFSMISSLLSSYDGIYAGFKLTKK